MFSDYASRFSSLRLSQNPHAHRPLFHSTVEDRDEVRESLALRQSRAGAGGRFGVFGPLETRDEDDEEGGSDHEAMQSSWRPPISSDETHKQMSRSRADDNPMAESETLSETGDPDCFLEEIAHDEEAGHNEAPDDIMFGVPLDDSIPPRSLAGSTDANRPSYNEIFDEELADSIDRSILGQKPEPLPDPVSYPDLANVHHDRTFSVLYMMCQASIFATSVFVYLRTDLPTTPMMDSIYSALASSTGLIVQDVVIAVCVAGAWLVVMRSFVRPLIYLVLVAVPVVFTAFSCYSLVWSYKGNVGGYELQARAMRWSSLLTALFAVLWIYTAYNRRYAMSQAIQIVRLACTILERNLHLVTLSVVNLTVFICYSFLWLIQFERIFLRGTIMGSGSARIWRLDRSSWLLGAYFILSYLWTLGVSSGIQRAATSAVVSQWYFHRHAQPSVPQKEVVKAGAIHALSTSFGSVCASSLFALLTRLPLLALPKRFSGILSLGVYMLFSAPIMNLTQPLTLSYASIHSIPLSLAASGIRDYPSRHWTSYRTAKMLLSAARVTTALGLSTVSWVASARKGSDGGSLYGYIVALIAGVIGWAIVGAVEGMVSIIVDSSLVCYNIDATNSREGRSHCLEAVAAFSSTSARMTTGALHV